MLLNDKIDSPYNKFAPEGSIPIISKSFVKSKLSNKFYEMTSKETSEYSNPKNMIQAYSNNNTKSIIKANYNSKEKNLQQFDKEDGEDSLIINKMTFEAGEEELDLLKSTIMNLKGELKVIVVNIDQRRYNQETK